MNQVRVRRKLEEIHDAAFGWALHCCRGNPEEAADVLQSVYVKVLDEKARFQERSSFKTWFFAVIRNTAAKRRSRLYRSLKALREMKISESTEARGVSRIFQSELRQRIGDLIRNLSERQQEVLHLVFYQEMTIEEAAQVMGVSLGSARTHYQRGKVRLQKEMKKSGLENEFRKRKTGTRGAVSVSP